MVSNATGNLKGTIFLCIYLLLIPTSCFSVLEEVRDVQDLCRTVYNKHMFYLEEDSSFRLNLRSGTIPYGSAKMLLQKTKKCTLLLKACSFCHITVTIQNMTIQPCLSSCDCNHFQINEPLSDHTTHKYCGDRRDDVQYFESKTRILSFSFVQSVHKLFYVSLTFNVSRNMFFLSEELGSSLPRHIETPYFPSEYPSDYMAEYIFTVKSPMGYVQLLFIDFQLSIGSYIEITGHDGTHTEVYDGSVFRPPPIISQGKNLKLRFLANDQPSRSGFTAMYMYGRHNFGESNIIKPITSCGGNIAGYEGEIQVEVHHLLDEIYDCIWLIYPPLFSEQSLLSSSVLDLKNIGEGYLELRQGLTSKGDLMKDYRCTRLKGLDCILDSNATEVIVPVSTGLFIRYRGTLRRESTLVMNYFVFKESNCTSDQFICSGGRCISEVLLCDGFRHCPEGDDEGNCSLKDIQFFVSLSTSAGTSELNTAINEIPSVAKKQVSLSGNSIYLVFLVLGSCGILGVFLVAAIILSRLVRKREVTESQPLTVMIEPQNLINPAVLRRLSHHTEDCPPTYEDVIAYNDRYPPLFYTRRKHLVETSYSNASSKGTPCNLSLYEGQGNPLSVSECDIGPDALPNASSSFVINLNCSVSSYELLDPHIGTKRLRRSLSLDLKVKKCHCQSICVCGNSPNLKQSPPNTLRRTKSFSSKLTSPFRFQSKISIYENPISLCEDVSCSAGEILASGTGRCYSCSFVARFPMSASGVSASRSNTFTEFNLRQKTYSF